MREIGVFIKYGGILYKNANDKKKGEREGLIINMKNRGF